MSFESLPKKLIPLQLLLLLQIFQYYLIFRKVREYLIAVLFSMINTLTNHTLSLSIDALSRKVKLIFYHTKVLIIIWSLLDNLNKSLSLNFINCCKITRSQLEFILVASEELKIIECLAFFECFDYYNWVVWFLLFYEYFYFLFLNLKINLFYLFLLLSNISKYYRRSCFFR